MWTAFSDLWLPAIDDLIINFPDFRDFAEIIAGEFSHHFVYPVFTLLFIAGVVYFFIYTKKEDEKSGAHSFGARMKAMIIFYAIEVLLGIFAVDTVIRYNMQQEGISPGQGAMIASIVIIAIVVGAAYFSVISVHSGKQENKGNSSFFIFKSLFTTIIFLVFIFKDQVHGSGIDLAPLADFNYVFKHILRATVFNIFMMGVFFVYMLLFLDNSNDKVFFKLLFIFMFPPFFFILIAGIILVLFIVLSLIAGLQFPSGDDYESLNTFYVLIMDSFNNFLSVKTLKNLAFTTLTLYQ